MFVQSVVLMLATATGSVPGADRPQWGEAWSRNMVSSEKGLPDSFIPGEKDPQGSGIRMATTTDLWSPRLGRRAMFF